MAAADVALAVTDAATAAPANGIVEIGGPERIPFPQLLHDVLAADRDPRSVVGDVHARYFGTELDDDSITTGPDARLGTVTFSQWLEHHHA